MTKPTHFRFGSQWQALLAIVLTACSTSPEPTIAVDNTSTAAETINSNDGIERPTLPTDEIINTPAATETPAEPTTTPTPEASPTPTLNAITETLNATEAELTAAIEEYASQAPLIYNEGSGSYELFCILENIHFLRESAYTTIGDYDILVVGDCSYLDINGDKQTVRVALSIQNHAEETTWMPHRSIVPGIYARNGRIKEAFEESAGGIEPGSRILVSFGLPNSGNEGLLGGRHNADLASEVYVSDNHHTFAESGNPEELTTPLIPFDVLRSSNQPNPSLESSSQP